MIFTWHLLVVLFGLRTSFQEIEPEMEILVQVIGGMLLGKQNRVGWKSYQRMWSQLEPSVILIPEGPRSHSILQSHYR